MNDSKIVHSAYSPYTNLLALPARDKRKRTPTNVSARLCRGSEPLCLLCKITSAEKRMKTIFKISCVKILFLFPPTSYLFLHHFHKNQQSVEVYLQSEDTLFLYDVHLLDIGPPSFAH